MATSEHLDDEAREATNPETPEARLNKLAEIAPLRPLVAANPNTALPTLLRLACDFPHEFLANPAVPLHLLVQPDLAEHLPDIALAQIVAISSTQTFYFNAARKSRSKMLQDALTDHVAIAGADYSNWERHAIARIRKRSTQIAFPHRQKTREASIGAGFLAIRGIAPWALRALARHRSRGFRNIVSKHPDMPVMMPVQLSEWQQRRRLAANPATPLVMLREFAASRIDSMLRELVAANPALPDTMIEALSYDSRALVGVARNPSIPAEVATRLAQSKNQSVLESLVCNPNIPPELLRTLLLDRHLIDIARVRLALQHQSLPESVFGWDDHRDSYLRFIAGHPNSPETKLRRLAQHGNAQIAGRWLVMRRRRRKFWRPLPPIRCISSIYCKMLPRRMPSSAQPRTRGIRRSNSRSCSARTCRRWLRDVSNRPINWMRILRSRSWMSVHC